MTLDLDFNCPHCGAHMLNDECSACFYVEDAIQLEQLSWGVNDTCFIIK